MSLALLVTLVGTLSGTNAPSIQAGPPASLHAAQSQSLTAGQAPSASIANPSITAPPKKRPFIDLFRIPQSSVAQTTRAPSRVSTPNPRVVCGLTMYEMSSDIDPKAVVNVPNRGVEFKIRRIIPSTCRE